MRRSGTRGTSGAGGPTAGPDAGVPPGLGPWLEDAASSPSDRDLAKIVRIVYEKSGIHLHNGKRALVVARLQKRLRLGGFRSFADYVRHVEDDTSGEEIVGLLDAIATNHTNFFREPQHFDLLRREVVPALLARPGHGPIEGWSAACSTGEEPCTIAMTLREAVPPGEIGRVRLLASDISTKALRAAQAGVYRMDRVHEIPPETLRRFFERGLGEQSGLVRVRTEVRQMIQYSRLNLIEPLSLGRTFDFIFCRNVMIYFDRAVQQRVVALLERHLGPGGYLFISHSESLNGLTHNLRWVAPAVYRRKDA